MLSCVTFAQTVRTSFVPGIKFSKYHTYMWVSVKGQTTDSTLGEQIKRSLDSQFLAKGLMKVDQSADLYVDYQIAVSKVKKWEVYEDWTQTGPTQRLPQRRQVTIDVGTLVIDMYDTAKKDLVWSGRAHKVVDFNSSPEDRQTNLDKAARQLLMDFPPK